MNCDVAKRIGSGAADTHRRLLALHQVIVTLDSPA